MADFDRLRQQLRESREQRDAAASGIAAARQRLKRIAAQETELDRAFNQDNRAHVAEHARLRRERDDAEAELKRQTDAQRAAVGLEAGVLKDFVKLTDPRDGIARLDDSTPILLMPVRLETRFKGAQLWVRVYPDDCWLDSFDPTLTKNEVANAKAYWIATWQAGGIEDQERGAWRGLVASHGSARASWIVQQFQPANLAAKPTKPRAEDVILTIATEAPLNAAEEAAAKTYWRDAWLADGDAAQMASAQAALEAAVGAARAADIATNYVPANFATPLTGNRKKSDVTVGIAFVIFAPIDTKQTAWSHAPKLTILPDRFVFIGYEGGNATKVALGNPVPSPLIAGPDPSLSKDEQLQHDAKGNLAVPDELKWLSDFDRALEVGMGFRIDLTETQRRRGFERVLVVGLRLNADKEEAKAELETLFQHHARSRTGLAVVPQGTPTNNTEASGAGFARRDDPDESFDDNKQPLFALETDWLEKKDGQWLAEYLGLDPALFAHTHHADADDQRIERAMNIALFPATLGYWMETMMAPVFKRDAIEQTREFFNRYVVGSGAIPALRIGRQPYGVLPATAHSRSAWFTRRTDTLIALPQDPMLAFLSRLQPLLEAMAQDWSGMLGDVSFVGKGGDPHATLLDIVGLHPGSIEWSQRYAESLQTLYNRLNLLGRGGLIQAFITAAQRAASRRLLTELGFAGQRDPFILSEIFSGKHNVLNGGAVDDKPLSETQPIRAYTDFGQNYLQWLIDAANTSLDALYAQDGFTHDTPPAALLFLLLRHALQLGYHDVSVRLHENAGLFTPEMAALARSDDPFLHIRNNTAVSESRYQPLYATPPQITGSSTVTVSQFITPRIGSLSFASYLRDQLAATERLKTQPSARLERAFADHVDCCSYRLDAWRLGVVNCQLALMRNLRDRSDVPSRPGIYLGAYAWLEDVRPEEKVRTPVTLVDPDLRADFAGDDEPPLMRDSTNQGYIHAPSLNHAVAAAVLRNGFISNASPENRETMAVNLTSERVRTALGMLEGIRAGQGLADLLGYQFERGLHDRHNLAEVDRFIYKLRAAFPLRANRLKETMTPGEAIENVEARNVVDGLALVEHMQKTGNTAYPFGRTDLPATQTQAEADALNAEAGRLLDTHDAVADLALSEGVYQAVVGNYDRVASTYDAYARGNFPPEPDVIRTPLKGIDLTHRVALHMESGADPNVSPIAGLPMTPRAQAEPALNRWLATILPPLEQVGCRVEFRDAVAGATTIREVTLKQLDLQPADLLAIVRNDNEQAMSELDDRIVRFAVTNFGPRPDVPIRIHYIEKDAAPVSVFELMPLVRNLRRLTTKSRPLRATDLALMNETESDQDGEPFIDKARLDAVRNAMQTLLTDVRTFQTLLEGPLSDLANRRGEILTDVDDYVAELTALLARAATFVVTQAGWGFAYDFQRRTFSALLAQVAERATRWSNQLAEFNARLAEEAALPLAATPEEHFALLLRAESVISTATAAPLPPTPGLFRTNLETVKQVAFANKLGDLEAVADTTRTKVSLLLAYVRALLPLTDFDAGEFSLAAHEDEMVRFVEDAARLMKVIGAELDRRLKAAQTLFNEHAVAAAPAAKTRALESAATLLLGDDFRVFPEFSLGAAQGDELENALAASRSRELFTFLENPPDPAVPPLDFPVDTWLYGVARVREKMFAWEQMMMFSGSFQTTEPELDALQLPFAPGDRWLGLEFPPDLKLDHDRLLYTAHFAAPFNKAASQCGLLLDEWTETIPASDADTGITFHYDRPNCEAPQSMLLVTPTDFRGTWRWDDLIDALNETLALVKTRAVEPRQLDASPYAPFFPAAIIATQASQLTIAADLALNNKLSAVLATAK